MKNTNEKVLSQIYGLLKHIKGISQSFNVEISLADCYDQQGMFEHFSFVMYPKNTEGNPVELTLSIEMLDTLDLNDILQQIEIQANRGIASFHEGNMTKH